MNLEEGKAINLQFDKRGGLLPVIVQNFSNGEILMLGYSNQEAFNVSLEKKLATFWSTSRQQLWTKGETSGDYLEIKEVLVDCDQDAIIYKVEMKGSGACHTYNKDHKHRKSCFYRKLNFTSTDLEYTEE